jgi:hypothetical protein
MPQPLTLKLPPPCGLGATSCAAAGEESGRIAGSFGGAAAAPASTPGRPFGLARGRVPRCRIGGTGMAPRQRPPRRARCGAAPQLSSRTAAPALSPPASTKPPLYPLPAPSGCNAAALPCGRRVRWPATTLPQPQAMPLRKTIDLKPEALSALPSRCQALLAGAPDGWAAHTLHAPQPPSAGFSRTFTTRQRRGGWRRASGACCRSAGLWQLRSHCCNVAAAGGLA